MPLRIAMLVLLLYCATLVKADKEIWLLADIHVMAPTLLDSPDNKAWKKDLADQRKMQDLSAPIFDLIVERIIARKPDALLIAGDLTKDGETAMPDLSRAYPGGTFRTDVGGSLLQYTRGEKGWDDFVSDVKTMWNRAVEAGKDLLQVN